MSTGPPRVISLTTQKPSEEGVAWSRAMPMPATTIASHIVFAYVPYPCMDTKLQASILIENTLY